MSPTADSITLSTTYKHTRAHTATTDTSLDLELFFFPWSRRILNTYYIVLLLYGSLLLLLLLPFDYIVVSTVSIYIIILYNSKIVS